jgi:hypothetical protein
LHIVGGKQKASRVRTKTEGVKGIPRNEFGVPGLCWLILASAPDGHLVISGFKSSKAGEAGGVIAELLILRVGEQRPVVHRLDVVGKPTVHAALLVVADAQESRWVINGQGTEEHGVHQGKDGRGSANAERQGEDGSQGEAGGTAQLPQCMLQISQHGVSPSRAGFARYVFLLQLMHAARHWKAGLSF